MRAAAEFPRLALTPSRQVPLIIFEARYRVLFSTLLSGLPDVDDDLVSSDGPLAAYTGSREFGMALAARQGVAATGCMLRIEHHERLPDGRLLVKCKGDPRRFSIKSVVRELPVLVCEVAWLEDEVEAPGTVVDGQTLEQLAAELHELYKTTIALSTRMRREEALAAAPDSNWEELLAAAGVSPEEAAEEEEPADIPPEVLASPLSLSFWLVRVFEKYPSRQQALLETTSTRTRLLEVKEVLANTRNYLGARSSLKSALADIPDTPPTPDAPPKP